MTARPSVLVRSERPAWSGVPSLTQRQYEVLRLSATGASASEVGAMLGVGYSAVHQMLMRLYRKFGTGGLVETFAVLGWLAVPESQTREEAA